jgi:cysteine synthase A
VYAEKLLSEHPEYFGTNQFENEANPQAHFDTTGPEIVAQAGVPDYFICGVGTGGTINGIAKYLAGLNPAVKVIAVEPTESRIMVGGTHHPHTIMGIGSGVVPVFIESLAPGQAMAEVPTVCVCVCVCVCVRVFVCVCVCVYPYPTYPAQ